MRNVLAIIAGYAVFAIISVLLFDVSGVNPAASAELSFIIISAIVGGLAAVLSGYITALIAKNKKYWPVLVLASILLVIAVISIIAQPEKSYWSEFMTIIFFVPLVLLGGYWRHRKNVKIHAANE